MNLSAKQCTPCQGGVEPIDEARASEMMAQVPGWSLANSGKLIERCYKRKNFADALELVNRIGEIAEQEGHHPDIKFGWGYVTVEFFTHKIGGLHENDFIMAAKVNELVEP